MEIRKIRKEDKSIYLNLTKQFYSSDAVLHNVDENNFLNTFNELINRDIYTECFIIEENLKIIGYCLISKTYSQEVGGMVLLIEEILILEDYRNRGIGKKIFNFLFERYKGYKRYRLEVDNNNVMAQKLYKKLGFFELKYVQMVIE
ncbi:GNAT family N-acetyltransferase [Streptobacillus notomytis]|uniref:GNAT family N-acetyltransferase n=1 Tax=Streptobacillus notomytis TaxID=1712031 RepID=UPI0009362C0B|nr:GNAT family N-acetyltransferase [Streptobacillus notomytis]